MQPRTMHQRTHKLTKLQLIKSILFIGALTFATLTHADFEEYKPEPLSEARLEQLLAPIALYPDTILSHILIAATYPLEVVQAERWLLANPTLKGSDAVEAAEDQEWDPSVRALLAFPEVVKRLSRDLDWTRELGEAFLQDEEQVLASVQSLRKLAAEHGNLDNLEKLSVSREEDAILIEPVEREIVYLPYYDTRTVYGPWRWSAYDPIYWDCPYHVHYRGYDRHSSIVWGPRVSVSFGFAFSSLHWRDRYISRIPYSYYRPRQYYYTNREIIRHDRARRWEHNARHRRGVAYRNSYLTTRYPGHNRYYQPDAPVYREQLDQNETRQRIRQMSVDSQAQRRATVNSRAPAVRPTINQRVLPDVVRTQRVTTNPGTRRDVDRSSIRTQNNALIRDRSPAPARVINRNPTPQIRQSQQAAPTQQAIPRQRVQATPSQSVQRSTAPTQTSQRTTSTQPARTSTRVARPARPSNRTREGMRQPR